MGDLALGGVGIDGRFDRNAHAIPRCQRTAVARLSARGRVENRAVEHDAALLGECDHARLAGLEIGVVAEQTFGRHRQVFSNGGLMSDLRSSQSGTGNFFERRNSGSNSLD